MFEKLKNEAQLIWRLLLDQRIELWKKGIPLLAILYVLSPFDLIPDFIIGLGQLDDLGILLGSLRLFRSLVPEYIIAEHQEVISGAVIEASHYEVIDDGDGKRKN
jgi:uncharacterized membrane protein YkvA (DUF1232 family)